MIGNLMIHSILDAVLLGAAYKDWKPEIGVRGCMEKHKPIFSFSSHQIDISSLSRFHLQRHLEPLAISNCPPLSDSSFNVVYESILTLTDGSVAWYVIEPTLEISFESGVFRSPLGLRYKSITVIGPILLAR